jgi:hypothetical protein
MTDPRTWTRHGGAVEPGSAFEPNPEFRVHFTDEEREYVIRDSSGRLLDRWIETDEDL